MESCWELRQRQEAEMKSCITGIGRTIAIVGLCFPFWNAVDAAGAGPPNDDCEDAKALEGDVVALPFNTSEATFDGPGWCVYGPNIWYCYTAPCSGVTLVNLCGSSYDTMLAVYDGCQCDPYLDMLECNDDGYCEGEWSLQSEILFEAVAGHQYLIEVGGYDDFGGMGYLTIECGWTPDGACCVGSDCVGTMKEDECETLGGEWYAWEDCDTFSCPWPPENDNCADAITIDTGAQYFTNRYATTDGPTEIGECADLESDVWFRYVPDTAGETIITIRDAAFDTMIAVYQQSCPMYSGTVVECNDDAWGALSQLTFHAEAGIPYLIRLGGYEGDEGDGYLFVHGIESLLECAADINGDEVIDVIDLLAVLGAWGLGSGPEDLNGDGVVDVIDLLAVLSEWGDCPPLSNDDCDAPVTVGDGTYLFDTSRATYDLDDPPWGCGGSDSADIWFCYLAETTGVAHVTLDGSGFDSMLQAFESCEPPLWILGCNNDYWKNDAGLAMEIDEGQWYRFRVGGYSGSAGPGRMSIQSFDCTMPYCPMGSYGNPPYAIGHDGPYDCVATLFGYQHPLFASVVLVSVVGLVTLQLLGTRPR